MEHLVELGHTRIAHLAGPQSTSTGVVRARAFHSALRGHGLEDDPSLVVTCDYWSEEEGARALRQVLDAGTEFTAVVAGNDLIALGCYDVFAERGIDCPSEVSVVGFNDMPFLDKLRPPLTTVAVSAPPDRGGGRPDAAGVDPRARPLPAVGVPAPLPGGPRFHRRRRGAPGVSPYVDPQAGPPAFGDAEMLRRRTALDAVMAEVGRGPGRGARREPVGSGVQWLSGWPVTREAVVVHGGERRDVLLVQFFNHVPQATRVALGSDVRWAGPRLGDTVLEELRAREDLASSRVGVIGALPVAVWSALRAAGADVVDLNPAYTRLRMRKSPEELDWLRTAARLTDASCAAMRDGARPGTSEHQLNALVEGSYLPLGGTSYIHYFSVTSMSDPRQCVPSQWPAAAGSPPATCCRAS